MKPTRSGRNAPFRRVLPNHFEGLNPVGDTIFAGFVHVHLRNTFLTLLHDAVLEHPRGHARDGRTRRAAAAPDPRRGRPAGDGSRRHPGARPRRREHHRARRARPVHPPAAEIEASEGGLSAGMYISNPFTDVPELFTSAVVTTDGDPDRAAREALAQAEGLWEVHERMQQPLVSLEEAVEDRHRDDRGHGHPDRRRRRDELGSDRRQQRRPGRRSARPATRDGPRPDRRCAGGRGGVRGRRRRDRSGRPSAAGSIPRASRRCRSRARSTCSARDCSRANRTGTCGSAAGRRSSRPRTRPIVVDEPSRSCSTTARCFYAHGQDPTAVRRRGRQVAALPAAHVRRLGGAGREHRCAGRDQREPAQPRPHASARGRCSRSTTR